MPSRRALRALLLGGLAAVAATTWAQTPAGNSADTYTIQRGDTLSGIAHRLGVTTEAIQQANDLPHPDRLSAGHVLRLPAAARPPAATPAATATAAAPAGRPPATEAKTTPPSPPASPKTAAPASATPPQAADAPTPAATAGTAKTPQAGGAVDTDQLALGVYKHPALGTLRITKGPDGVILNKDNKSIPMRRLLYAIYDGTDAAGNVHNIDLVFDDAGHVAALRYSSGGTGLITFEKMKK